MEGESEDVCINILAVRFILKMDGRRGGNGDQGGMNNRMTEWNAIVELKEEEEEEKGAWSGRERRVGAMWSEIRLSLLNSLRQHVFSALPSYCSSFSTSSSCFSFPFSFFLLFFCFFFFRSVCQAFT